MNPQLTVEELKKYYPPDYKPHGNLPRIKHSKRKKQNYEIRYLCDNLNDKSNLLDVGCGDGGFLNDVKNAVGCNVFGLDIAKKAAEAAKINYGLDIYVGTIAEAPFPNGYFDVITARQYLEHIPDPVETMQKIFMLLKPGGTCIISTPNFNSFNAKIFKERWYGLDCPRHLCIYSLQTLSILFEKTGFTIKKIIRDKSSKGLLGSLQYLFYGDNYDEKHRNKIKRSRLLKMAFSPLTRIFAMLGKADNMIVFVKKISVNETFNNK